MDYNWRRIQRIIRIFLTARPEHNPTTRDASCSNCTYTLAMNSVLCTWCMRLETIVSLYCVFLQMMAAPLHGGQRSESHVTDPALFCQATHTHTPTRTHGGHTWTRVEYREIIEFCVLSSFSMWTFRSVRSYTYVPRLGLFTTFLDLWPLKFYVRRQKQTPCD